MKKGKYINCLECGKLFYRFPYASKTRKFCSTKCYWKHESPNKGIYRERITKICPICNKEFWHHKKTNKIYCSRQCYHIGGKTKIDKEKRIKTICISKNVILNEYIKIKKKGNRAIIVDSCPRPDIIEIDFKKKKIIAHEIETNETQLHKRKVTPYIEQFKKLGLTYDRIIVKNKENTKHVWQKFPIKQYEDDENGCEKEY